MGRSINDIMCDRGLIWPPTNADLMREWRIIASLNTTAAGDRLGISARTVENIEQGRRRVGDVGLRIALEALIASAKKSTRHRK